MAKKPLSSNMKLLHKKLMPANIIMCVIALVAGFCMLFMPWLDMRVHIEGEKLAEILSEQNSSTASTEDNTLSTFAGQEINQENIIMDALAESLKGVSFDIPINLYPMKLLKATKNDKAEIEQFVNSVIGKSGAKEFVQEFVDEVAPVVVKAMLNTTIEQLIVEASENLTEEELELIEKYNGEVSEALDSIANNPSVENAKAELNDIVDTIIVDYPEIGDEEVEMIRGVIDELVEQGANDGKFDYLWLLKNIDISAFEDIVNNNQPEPTPAYAVGDSSVNTFATTDNGTGESSTNNSIAEMMEILENPGAVITENLDEESIQIINIVCLVSFILFVGIPAFLCFLLAIISFIRIFTENKRVRYWYVLAVLGIAMCMLILLNVLGSVLLPGLLSTFNSAFTAINIKFLGSGIVSSVCFVLLCLLSLIYYRRVKKQIKEQYKKENPK